MAGNRRDGDKQEPSLELPKLFGRKRSSPEAEEPEPAPEQSAPEPESSAPDESHEQQTQDPTQPLRHDEPPNEPAVAPAETPPEGEAGSRRAERTGPPLPRRLAALLAGLVVGAIGTAATYGALAGCELVAGTGSCGGGPGLLLLVAIFAVMVLVGGALLRWWGVDEPQSTSFLAVGITAVVVMLVLLEAVFTAWMFLAVPLVSMAAFWVAAWTTTRFVETEDQRPRVDVR